MIDNEAHLLALKRVLDTPRDHGIPNEHQSVVREGELTYFKLDDRAYTAAEPRALVELVLQGLAADQQSHTSRLGPAEWHAMYREREQAGTVAGTFHIVEAMQHLRNDLDK